MSNFEILDLRDHTGKIFVVGDIHGMFTLLEQELEKIGFNDAVDILLSVGDLVDRGPESHRAVEFAAKPWFRFVRGNHEDMCQQAGGTSWHVGNGGNWFNELPDNQTRYDTMKTLNDAPVIMEVLLPDGGRVGIVHADFPTNDWNDAERMADSFSESCMWDRSRIRKTVNAPDEVDNWIKNIDIVYFGHTPINERLQHGNCVWIDTGAVFGRKLTIERII